MQLHASNASVSTALPVTRSLSSPLSQTRNLSLLQTLLYGIGKIYPRAASAVKAMNEATHGGHERRLQADAFPDLALYASDTLCEKPVTDYIFPRVDPDDCSVPFLFNDVSNPPVDLAQEDISAIESVFNGVAMGLSYENSTDPNAELCSYTRISDDSYISAGHCFFETDTPESFVLLVPGYERANKECLVGEAAIVEHFYSNKPGETVYDPSVVVEDYGLVQLRESDATLDREAYPIAPVSTRLPEVGETVYMLGHPAGLPGTWLKTQVLELNTDNIGRQALSPTFKLDASSLSGVSGGPVVDKNGNVLGLASTGSRDRLSETLEDGTIEFGPMLVWAVSMQGVAANSDRVNGIILSQSSPQTSNSSGDVESLLPSGMEKVDQCLFNYLEGDAITQALSLTQNINVPESEFDVDNAGDDGVVYPSPAPTVQASISPVVAPEGSKVPTLAPTLSPTGAAASMSDTSRSEAPVNSVSSGGNLSKPSTYALGAVTATVAFLAI